MKPIYTRPFHSEAWSLEWLNNYQYDQKAKPRFFDNMNNINETVFNFGKLMTYI